MSADDHMATCRHVDFSNEYNQNYRDHALMKDFASDSMVKFLYGSNSQEGTLPQKRDGDTHIMVRDHFKNCDLFDTAGSHCQWNSDGRFNNQEKNQIFRHFNAKQSLSGQSVLTLDNVKRVVIGSELEYGFTSRRKTPIENRFFSGRCKKC